MKKAFWVAALLAGCAESPVRPFAYRVPPPDAPKEAVVEPREVPSDLTLEEAFRLMEAHHPGLAAARAEVEAARGRAEQAGRLPNPKLIGRVESAPFEGGTTDDAEYLAGVSQTLPVGGRLGAASDAAERLHEAKEAAFEARRLERRAAVRSAFAALLYMERFVGAREQALELARRGAAAARARVDAGDAVAGALARAELEVFREESELERVRAVRHRAARSLAGSIGRPGLRVTSARGDLEQALEVPALEGLLVRLGGDAWAAAGRAEVAAAQERLNVAEAERIPDIDVDLFYRRIGSTDEDAFDAGLGLSLPLFDGNSGAIRAARAEVEVAAARSEASRQEREVRLRSAHALLVSSVSRAKRYREEILPRAERVLRSAEARYAEGDESLSDLLPVRRGHIEVRTAYLESLRDALQAWSALRPFLGKGE